MNTSTHHAERKNPGLPLLVGLPDDELVSTTRTAWLDALTTNTYAEVRACQAEALRRGKAHLYDQGYIQFWLGIFGPADSAA